MSWILSNINEVDDGSNGLEKATRDLASNHSNNCSLDVPVLPPCHLVNMGNTACEMAISNTFVQTSESAIEFFRSQDGFAPHEHVVVKELVTCMKYFGGEKKRWIGHIPVAPEGKVNTTQTFPFCCG